MRQLNVIKFSYLLAFFLLTGCRIDELTLNPASRGQELPSASPLAGDGSPRVVMEAAQACGRQPIALRVENFSGSLGGAGLVFRYRSSTLQIHALNPQGNTGAFVNSGILWNVITQNQPGWQVTIGQAPIPIPSGFREFRSSYVSPNSSTGTPVQSGDVLFYLDATVSGDPEIEFTWENELVNERVSQLSFRMENRLFGCN
jgi:hypothetical protein